MDKLHHVANYVLAHWSVIVYVLGIALSLLGTIKNALSYRKDAKSAEAVTVIDHLMDVLSFVARNGSRGLLAIKGVQVTAPGIPSMVKVSK